MNLSVVCVGYLDWPVLTFWPFVVCGCGCGCEWVWVGIEERVSCSLGYLQTPDPPVSIMQALGSQPGTGIPSCGVAFRIKKG